MDVAAFIVSIVAVLISGASVAYARKQARSQAEATQIEVDRRNDELTARQMEEDRLRRADVNLTLAPPEANHRDALLLTNAGPAAAKAVSVTYVRPLSGDGGRDGAFDAIESRRYELSSGALERIGLTPDYETASTYEVLVRWSDESGHHELTRVINHVPS